MIGIDQMVHKSRLKSWLIGSHGRAEPVANVAALLDADPGAIPTMARRSIPFVLAVLRDTFVDDSDVRNWLTTARADLDHARPADLLLDGRVAEIEELAVQQWNQGTR